MGRKLRLSLLLTISVISFTALSASSASAAEVCLQFGAASFFDDSVATGECALAPATTTAETNNVTVTRTVKDDPSTPGQQSVSAIAFHDASNPVKLGEAPGICVQTDANTVTCSVSDYTFNLGPNDDTATITGAPTALPSTNGQPPSCPGFPSFADPTGGAGNDTINGSEGSDSFLGGDGNDTLNGNGGPDSIDGDSGDDTVHGNDGRDCIDGGDGNDGLNGDAGDDSLDNNDSSGNDTLSGGDGNDFLDPGFGPFDAGGIQTDNDTLSGGNGVDTVSYGNRNNRTVALTETEDGVANDGEAAHKDGAGTDIPAEADNIGNDIENLFGGAGPNTMTGNDQDNLLEGGPSNDNIQGNGGDDQISGFDGLDTLGGGDGRDEIFGNDGNDAVDGGAGDDTLVGGPQNDNVSGGAGDDELLDGDYNSIFFIGNVDGPGRPDATVPNSDSDVFSGGDGVDMVSYAGRSSSDPVTVTIDGQANDGEINVPNRLTENDNVGGDVEDVTGTDGADSITGSAADNNLTGGEGNDTIVGNGGNDALFGSRGADVLNGVGAGSTHLDGGDGNDTLVSQDTTRDENQCGAGTDSVQADSRDEVHGDCENVKVAPPAAVVIGAVTVTKTGYVLVRVTCPATEPSCVGVVTIKSRKKIGKIIIKLGQTSYRANGGKVSVVKALIPPKFRAALAKKKKVAVRVTVTNVNAVTGLSSTKTANKTVKTTVLKKKKK